MVDIYDPDVLAALNYWQERVSQERGHITHSRMDTFRSQLKKSNSQSFLFSVIDGISDNDTKMELLDMGERLLALLQDGGKLSLAGWKDYRGKRTPLRYDKTHALIVKEMQTPAEQYEDKDVLSNTTLTFTISPHADKAIRFSYLQSAQDSIFSFHDIRPGEESELFYEGLVTWLGSNPQAEFIVSNVLGELAGQNRQSSMRRSA